MASQPEYEPGMIRDRLANERTLLAWVRTSLALMAFGVAVEKFAVFIEVSARTPGVDMALPDPLLSQLVGVGLVVLGGLLAFVGGWRTRVFARVIDPDGRAPSAMPLALLAIGTVLVALCLVTYLVLA